MDVALYGNELLNLNVGDSASIDFTVIIGKFYGAELASKDIDNYSLTWTLNKNIAGISLNDGILTVNDSAQIGNYDLLVKVSAESEDLKGYAEKSITVNINNVAPVLEISQKSITAIKQESITPLTITAVKGTHNLNWSVNGTLPEGLNYKVNGEKFIISGTPDDKSPAKVYEFIVTASNDIDVISEIINITVKEIAPVIAENNLTLAAYKGKSASLAVTASQGTNLSWSYNGNLPAGLELTSDDMSAQISGSPQMGTSGNYELEIIASNSEGSASANIKISVAGSIETQAGESSQPLTIVTETGESMTETHTIFKNAGGFIILSADVAIITASTDFAVSEDEIFSQIISVDVIIDIADSDYDKYLYSLDISGLPEWLNVSGDLISSDTLDTGITEFNHVFSLTGRALTSQDKQKINITAIITISGDNLPLEALASKDINISVDKKIIPVPEPAPVPVPDPVPDPEPDPIPDPDPEKIISLTSINAALSGSESITLTEGESGAIILNASVSANFSDNTTKILSQSEYISLWESNFSIPGITFNNGVLNISTSAKAGSYDISVKFTASSGDISGGASINIKANIKALPVVIIVDDDNNNDNKQDEQQSGGETVINTPADLSELISGKSDEELQQIKTLTLDSNVKDLSGLEKLTNLEELDLTGANSLESINLSGNTSIKQLDLTGNTGVKTLDLSGSNIEILDAQECENLQELNIEGCENLTYLNVSSTDLTSLNVKDCANLTVLEFSSCNVNNLNLEGCKSLEYLNCGGNALTRLDASGFPVLQELLCANQVFNSWESSKIFTASISNDSGKIINLKAWDVSGNIISADYDNESGQISFAGTPAKFSYDYVTGFEDVKMDVVIFAANPVSDNDNNDSDTEINIPGSSGGCNAGLSVLALILCWAAMSKKR